MQPWQTLSRRRVLQAGDGRFLRVEYHNVQLPDGSVIEDWPWLDTPSFVNVVAETDGGSFLCFRQSKYAVEDISLAIPGGYLEADEEPLDAVQRELREETGYAAETWTFLGKFVVDGNRGNGHAHLFLARGARYVQPIDADDLEEQELVLLTRAELEHALHAGEIKVLPWAANVAMALARLEE